MKTAPFECFVATSLADAIQKLAETADEGGRIIAGGQSLIPMMALRVAYPPYLIDINQVAELQGTNQENGRLKIRAVTRHSSIERGLLAGTTGKLLEAVALYIAHHPIRERGTFCGSVANSDPSSEWCLVTATLDGEIEAVSVHGTRLIPASSFFVSIMTTSLEPNELLASVSLPLLPETTKFGFSEFNRRAGDFAMAMCLATLELKGGLLTNVRLGVGGVEPFPRRLLEVEHLLEGQVPTNDLIESAAQRASLEIDPLEDQQVDADYRRDLTRAMVRRSLVAAIN